MPTYRIEDEIINPADADAQETLARAHTERLRPLCLCKPQGVVMYVAKFDGHFLVKRMPNTGRSHAIECESFEPPDELTGLGEVQGSAIREDLASGEVTLNLGFSLSKAPGKTPPAPSDKEVSSVKADTTKLTLRSTFDYLIDQAGFNRWTPRMTGKRTWGTFYKYLMQAAGNKKAKKADLSSLLYIPEPFYVDRRAEIARARELKLAPLASQGGGKRKLMMLVAEVKELAPGRFGHKLIAKHLADFHFAMPDDLHTRLLKRFGAELNGWEANPESHLMIVATFGLGAGGYATLEEAAFVLLSENWIPYENAREKELLDALTLQKRSFIKGLRYQLRSSKPMAAAVLTDTQDPTAIYISEDQSEEFDAELQQLIDDSSFGSWIWMPGHNTLTELPSAAGGAS
ncbi:DUF1173 domain-containing protein [Achromobacter spanius]|uniref:DUF1173 domain-containing protein n=1 Tax=Achromobacter spanius TaxID=217203 RepID=UPI0037F9B6FE